jgi:RNA polymerase sigma factor (sigma-70 family)
LLALAGDERLVSQIRRGSDAAFDIAYERYGPGILAFCRHMLGSREEAEDAVQHVFACAYRDLLRDEREIRLKPWLYTIARNRCLSMLRAHRDELGRDLDQPTPALAEQVERQAELRDLLRDLRDLPEEQRSALLLSEVGDLSHAEVAGVLGCKVAKVKALVHRARSGLIKRRDARETPCAEIRELLSTLRGGSLKRSGLRHHVRHCAGCREFQAEVKNQRGMLRALLPMAKGLTLKSALSAGASAVGSLSGTTLVTVAVVGALAGGGAAVRAGGADHPHAKPPARPVAFGAAAADPTAVPPVGVRGGELRTAPASGAEGGRSGARAAAGIRERPRSKESLEPGARARGKNDLRAASPGAAENTGSRAPEADAPRSDGGEADGHGGGNGGPPGKGPKQAKAPKPGKGPKAPKKHLASPPSESPPASPAPKAPPRKAHRGGAGQAGPKDRGDAKPAGPKDSGGGGPAARAPASPAPASPTPATKPAATEAPATQAPAATGGPPAGGHGNGGGPRHGNRPK